MRERLIVAFVSLTLVLVVALLLERASTTTALIREQAQREVDRSATTIAALVRSGRAGVVRDDLRSVLEDGERLVHVGADGQRVVLGPLDADDAGRDDAGRDDAGDLTASRPVPGGGTVTLTRAAEVVDARVAAALLPLALVAVGLLVAGTTAVVLLARRFARPFAELAQAAARVGRGDLDVEVPRSRIPEADAVARALRACAHDLSALGRREREFAARASHDLRTPITATRLELEDLAASPASPEVVARITSAIWQLDRLSATVNGMLDASRASRIGSRMDIDLAALVRDAVDRWRGLTPSRRFEPVCDAVVAVRMPVGALLQAMDVLIGNAVVHGRGTITVRVSEQASYAEVRVSDEGPRPRHPSETGDTGSTGSGLVTATEIAESLGGQLRLTEDDSTTYSLLLPLAARETVEP
jgi:signal transduction histidine kinase